MWLVVEVCAVNIRVVASKLRVLDILDRLRGCDPEKEILGRLEIVHSSAFSGLLYLETADR